MPSPPNLSYPFIVLYVSIHNMFILLLIYMYMRAPWKIGYIQMGHPRKIKKLLTYLLTYLLFVIYIMSELECSGLTHDV